eukprot:TRINITY_DN21109_c0_g1_i1.p1 TRINITY_DN21109_c0_g1~~TRINITY_DN21109_c0_g1_i1.p1  ORF type:complete len:132 (-),score=11.30 TRINITY_DN21109_c0_g1_i1:10-360(-)
MDTLILAELPEATVRENVKENAEFMWMYKERRKRQTSKYFDTKHTQIQSNLQILRFCVLLADTTREDLALKILHHSKQPLLFQLTPPSPNWPHLVNSFLLIPVSYTHLTLPTNREV